MAPRTHLDDQMKGDRDRCIEAGINFLDTANIYQTGLAEGWRSPGASDIVRR